MSKIKAVPAAKLPTLSIATLSMYDVNATANKLVEPNDYTRKPIVYYPSYEITQFRDQRYHSVYDREIF
jgi:hypothetical protein